MRNYNCKHLHFHLRIHKNVTNIFSSSRKYSNLIITPPKQTPETPFPSARKLRYVRQKHARILQTQVFTQNPVLHYKTVHAQTIVSGLYGDVLIGNMLIDLYSNVGCLGYAYQVFDKLRKKNLVSWSTLIKMYAKHGFGGEALRWYLEFRRSDNSDNNEYVLASVAVACTEIGVLGVGRQVHGVLVKCGLGKNMYVGTSMVGFYAKVGKLDDALMVFDEIKERNLYTWTTVMKGCGRCGRSDVSLRLFEEMMRGGEGVGKPDMYVLSSVLSACSACLYVEGGKEVHGYVLRRGTEMDVSVMNALVDCYVKCGRVSSGRRVFDHIVVKDSVSWATMIAGYMQNGFDAEAVQLFLEMSRLGWKLGDFVCSTILTSCSSLEDLVLGKQVHGYAIKASLETDEYVINGLIDMYCKCDSLVDARKAFYSLTLRNVVSYNAMIEGFCRQEQLQQAVNLFYDMRLEGLKPNKLTFVSLLGVSASLYALELIKQIHGLITKVGVTREGYISSALVDVYGKCNCLHDARRMFEEISEKDIVVWNAMLFGYVNEESLKLYGQLQKEDQKPNEFTYVAMITACSNLTALKNGQQFHNQLLKTGLDLKPFVTNALLNMYSKCGCLDDARRLFNTAKSRDVACWNAMISTYANHGEAEEAISLYKRMLNKGLQPNYLTFIGLLSACSHAGLVDAGLEYFDKMLILGIEPGTEHYACMVSLFGRAGQLSEAKKFAEKMPVKSAAIMWRSLLSACQASSDHELGTYAAEMALSSDPTDSGSYVLLANIYASKGMWAKVKEVRNKMESKLVVKQPGLVQLN